MDISGRWSHIQKLLVRQSPFVQPEFQPSSDTLPAIQKHVKILVIGAGGLGCELLKDLSLSGFGNLSVIDMDTIDLSNLNRQFLFRMSDVGKDKAQCAADFINKRVAGCDVKAYCNRIEDFDENFYRGFNLIVCGLDSVVARRWINSMVVSLLEYNENGEIGESSIIPIVDGGTEGFKGNARLILPGKSACIECTLDLYPPQVNFPMCTIAHTPRLPEHCVEYVKLLLWGSDKPFGEGVAIDGDDPHHINWIYQRALARANEYKITGVTYRLTQGVVKRIIPAVASTNAVIAAACATEVLKLVTGCRSNLNNYKNFNDIDGVYTYAFEAERKPDCLVCSNKPHLLELDQNTRLEDLIQYLMDDEKFRMKSPGLTTIYADGRSVTLYMQSAFLKDALKPNLKKTLQELKLTEGQQLLVSDPTSPTILLFILHYLQIS